MTANTKRINALHGALVADAATMGLHWMYDQDHIKKIEATGDILFRQPDANNYEGVKSYFAHGAKKRGEFSQYGESAKVVAQVFERHRKYDVGEHQQIFFDTFGPCGSYHGFADRPTKALVANMIARADDLPEASGSDDDQMPALCCVPALFTNQASQEDIAVAVSVTNTHAHAISGAQVLNDCLTRLHNGECLKDALTHSAATADEALASLMHESLSQSHYQPLETAQRYGLACHMPQGLPVAWHLLLHATDYESVIRDNIRCGGDSCGRSMAVGSIAGLAFGVPEKLKVQVNQLS
jgi:ADP-ribosylglycohydrolase